LTTAKKNRIVIYTDGACSGNPGNGGWGAVLFHNGREKDIYGGEKNTTNNKMELMAVIKALESIKKPLGIDVFTDSQYVKNGINSWIHNWKKNGWKTANKKPVKNKELWMELDELVSQYDVDWYWVKGHSGDVNNERADALARKGIELL